MYGEVWTSKWRVSGGFGKIVRWSSPSSHCGCGEPKQGAVLRRASCGALSGIARRQRKLQSRTPLWKAVEGLRGGRKVVGVLPVLLPSARRGANAKRSAVRRGRESAALPSVTCNIKRRHRSQDDKRGGRVDRWGRSGSPRTQQLLGSRCRAPPQRPRRTSRSATWRTR